MIRYGIGRAPVVDTIQVIRVVANRGAGTEDDPVREIQFLYDMGGTLIVEYDPVEGNTHYMKRGVDQFGDPLPVGEEHAERVGHPWTCRICRAGGGIGPGFEWWSQADYDEHMRTEHRRGTIIND